MKGQPAFDKYPAYHGSDLGLSYSDSSSMFRIWSPPAEAVELMFYKKGTGGLPLETVALAKSTDGTWLTKQAGNLLGLFYTFRVKINGKWNDEVTDPYAKAVGVNGKRALVINLQESNPDNWENDRPLKEFKTPTDAIIYELHVRDASIHMHSGILHKGKFLGLSETGTRSHHGLSTGLDHIKDLGVTHVHLLPFFDFNSVDEAAYHTIQYNWGYDPLNYNVPEGSYSTDPSDGINRIKELKQMIQSFHNNGLRVVFDAVYNHTALTENSNFNQLVPGYYYRHNKDGSFSNATGCNNETASEREMVRKFILESLVFWVKEYHIDGFRFDLMGVHDIETMNIISDTLHKIKPDILLYGEGWTAGTSPTPDSVRALKKNAGSLRKIAVFSDDMRDAIKGSVFDIMDRGFATNNPAMKATLQSAIVASGSHPQIDYNDVNSSKEPFSLSPAGVISYCECHDNNTLWDKIKLSCPDQTRSDHVRMHKLALTIVLTSQGIPFLHAGTEFLRSKKGVENSYKSSDSINAIEWGDKKKNEEVYHYVKALIRLRKNHSAFRMTTAAQIAKNLKFDTHAPEGTIVYTINAHALKDSWKKIWVAFNGSDGSKNVSLPEGHWKTALNSERHHAVHAGVVQLTKFSSMILYQE